MKESHTSENYLDSKDKITFTTATNLQDLLSEVSSNVIDQFSDKEKNNDGTNHNSLSKDKNK